MNQPSVVLLVTRANNEINAGVNMMGVLPLVGV
jgi:hypothetical protein